jgi:hypothetical protein
VFVVAAAVVAAAQIDWAESLLHVHILAGFCLQKSVWGRHTVMMGL